MGKGGKKMRKKGNKVPVANRAFKTHKLRLAPKATAEKGNKPFCSLREVATSRSEQNGLFPFSAVALGASRNLCVLKARFATGTLLPFLRIFLPPFPMAKRTTCEQSEQTLEVVQNN